MHWYLKVLKNYFNFKGRARRKEYWMFVLINFLIGVAIFIVSLGLGDVFNMVGAGYSWAVAIPYLAVTVRRLHDVNLSGWWLVGTYLPALVLILALFFMPLFVSGVLFMMSIIFSVVLVLGIFIATLMSGTVGNNKYGPDPKIM